MNPTPWRRAPGQRPLVLGHRGARGLAAENTILSFDLAMAAGADGVELDVRLTKDSVAVVFHDATLTRLTDGEHSERIDALSFSELRAVSIGGQPIPRLEEVLAWSRKNGALLNVELKSRLGDNRELSRRVASSLQEEPEGAARILLSSFSLGALLALRRLLPHYPRAWLVHEKQWAQRYTPTWRWQGFVALHPEHTLVTRHWLNARKSAGAIVNTWTVNDLGRAKYLADLGVDGIISDEPRLIAEGI